MGNFAWKEKLTDADKAEIAQSRLDVLEQIPEMADEIRELLGEGLVDGWRNVTYIGPPREKDPRTITLAEMQIGPWNITDKERKHGNGG